MFLQYLVICSVALLVAGLSLFSGFGLGTLLLPAFALFFPIHIAVAATALVHLANNFFKLILLGKKANWGVVLRFGLPGAAAAILGAWLLTYLEALPTLYTYDLWESPRQITVVKLVIAVIIIVFAVFELVPRFGQFAFDRKYLVPGGALSGFFGGLSGHQGALRSTFLIKAGLDKEEFVGTGVASSVIVDISRLTVYGLSIYSTQFYGLAGTLNFVFAAAAAAFLGSFLGRLLLKKITLVTVQRIVGVMLILIGVGMAAGLV